MPHRTPVEELQDLAEAQYRRKDYAAALLSVDEAIEQDRTSIRLFDTRAAIYEKLDDFVSALKDARAQIKLDEKDPRGYLRAGKVLIKMSKHEVALELYKRGISKSVRDVDTLQKMHDRLLKSLTPPTFVDPLASLPLEIFEIIMLKLRFGQMLSCMRVSKHWRSCITSLRPLWLDLNLSKSHSRYRIKTSVVSAYLKRSGYRTKSATLNNLLKPDGVYRLLPLQARYLSKLTIACASNPIDSAGLNIVLAGCTQLQELNFCAKSALQWCVPCPNLQSLKAMCDPRSVGFDTNSLIGHAPNLVSLHLYFWKRWTENRSYVDLGRLRSLEEFSISMTISDTFRLPATLKCLSTITTVTKHFEFESTDCPLPQLRSLTHVELAEALALLQYPEGTRVGSLQCLSIRYNLSDHARFCDLPWERLRDLEELALCDSREVDDDIAGLIASNCPIIETLDLSNTAVTGIGVKAIVSSLPKLRSLRLEGCEFLGRDAVEWARQQGIQMSTGLVWPVRGHHTRCS